MEKVEENALPIPGHWKCWRCKYEGQMNVKPGNDIKPAMFHRYWISCPECGTMLMDGSF